MSLNTEVDRREDVRVSQQPGLEIRQVVRGDLQAAESRRADITRQALSIIPANTVHEERSNYIAAGMIITLLSGWLGSAVFKSRAFAAFNYLLLFFVGAALAGIFLGSIVGKGFIPVEPSQVALFTIAGVSVFVLGVGLSLLLWSQRGEDPSVVDLAPVQHIMIPVKEVSPRVLILVKELNPRAGRRKTD